MDLSLAFARDIGLHDTLLCPDLAFAPDELLPCSAPRLAPGYFCVTGSSSLEHYDLAAFASAIRAVARATGLRPVFVHSRRRDGTLHATFFPEAEVLSSEELPDYLSLVAVLKGAVFTLGGRYHTAIAGLVHGIPALLLPGNNPKGEGLVQMAPEGVKLFIPSDTEAMAGHAVSVVAGGARLRGRILADVLRLQDYQQCFSQHLSARFSLGAPGVSLPVPSELMPKVSPLQIDVAAAQLYALINSSGAGPGPYRARLELAVRRILPGFTQSVERSFTDLP